MFFHFSVFLHSLIFLAWLEFVSSDWAAIRLENLLNERLWLFAFLALGALGYFFRVAHRTGKGVEMTPIPVLLAFASYLLLYFIDSPLEKHVFAVLTSLAYYFLHLGLHRLKLYAKDKTAHAIISAAGSATIFLFYAGAYGFYLNFSLPLWILMLAFSGVTFLVSCQYFSLVAPDRREMLKYSALLGFVMMEVAWAINFWPFGYLTTGVIALIFYYVFWDVVQVFLEGLLTKKRLVGNLVFFSILTAFVLLTSRWVAVV